MPPVTVQHGSSALHRATRCASTDSASRTMRGRPGRPSMATTSDLLEARRYNRTRSEGQLDDATLLLDSHLASRRQQPDQIQTFCAGDRSGSRYWDGIICSAIASACSSCPSRSARSPARGASSAGSVARRVQIFCRRARNATRGGGAGRLWDRRGGEDDGRSRASRRTCWATAAPTRSSRCRRWDCRRRRSSVDARPARQGARRSRRARSAHCGNGTSSSEECPAGARGVQLHERALQLGVFPSLRKFEALRRRWCSASSTATRWAPPWRR